MEGVDSAEAQGVAEMPTDFNGAKTLSTYLGISFAVFLGFLPRASISLVSALQFQNRNLSFNLFQAEEQLKQMKTRRAEDAKANAKVVEIFASHRSNWQKEEKRLLQQIEALTEESVLLKKKITEMMKSKEEFRVFAEKLQRDVDDREEVIHLISKKHEEEKLSANEVFASLEKMKAGEVASETEFQALRCQNKGSFGRNAEENGEIGDYGTDFSRIGRIRVSQGLDESGIGILKKERRVPLLPEFLKGISMENDGAFGLEQPSEACFWERNRESDALAFLNGQTILNRDLLPTPSKVWMERSSNLQDLQYDSLESLYQMKHYVARRESPWKVDGESTGVSSKLKLLEQELLNLERIGKPELAKVPSLMRKLAKRYQGLAGKIDDLCRRMASDPSEPNISSEFRTQRQTEFLLETFRLQQRAIEAGQKLTALHAEIAPSRSSDELGSQVNLSTRRSLSSIKNNFKEIQRNLEIWLARIMGDLEGILARDGMSRDK